jgi:hypothetical protein
MHLWFHRVLGDMLRVHAVPIPEEILRDMLVCPPEFLCLSRGHSQMPFMQFMHKTTLHETLQRSSIADLACTLVGIEYMALDCQRTKLSPANRAIFQSLSLCRRSRSASLLQFLRHACVPIKLLPRKQTTLTILQNAHHQQAQSNTEDVPLARLSMRWAHLRSHISLCCLDLLAYTWCSFAMPNSPFQPVTCCK